METDPEFAEIEMRRDFPLFPERHSFPFGCTIDILHDVLISRCRPSSLNSGLRSRVYKMASFDEFEHFQRMRNAWNSVRIERAVEYSLFTFGDSDLPYYLITRPLRPSDTVTIRRGSVTVSRARIITPDNMAPELRNFFENEDDHGFVQFLMSRSAAFSNMKLSNQAGPERIVTDTVEEAVVRLNRQLDDEEEDRTAILSAPAALAGFAVLKYASEKVLSSAPDNIQELRERGLLP